MPAPLTRNLTILLTDIKGFTDKTSNKSRSQIQEMLDRHRDIVLPVLESRGGKLIKTIGDAFLMVFESPTDAVLSGVAVQDALAKHNLDKPESDRLEVRIAINTGEVNLADNDIFGEPVNITARIEGVAQAGEVFFTEAVYLAMNKTEVPSSEVGQLQLKGIREKVRVYKVKREHPIEDAEPAGAGSAGARAALWERLRQVPAPLPKGETVEPAPKARIVGSYQRPPLLRRAAALVIDLILCGILVSFVRGRDENNIHVRYNPRKAAKAASNMKVDDQGVHGQIGDTKISIDDNGIDVSPASKKGDSVLKVGEKGIQGKISDKKISLDDRGVSIDPTTQDSQTLAEKGPWSITAASARRNYAFAIVWFLYSLLFLKRMSATPGMRILRLAVVAQDGSPMDSKAPIYRSAFSLLSGYAAGLGYLWGVWDKDRRTWHDLIAGTRVVSVE